MLENKIILVGYSGHGYVVAETALENQLRLFGYSEKLVNLENPFGLEFLGDENENDFIGWNMQADFLIGIGDNIIREKVFNQIEEKGTKSITLIHSSASISKFCTLGQGVFVSRNVSVNIFSNIGNNVILNTGCIIEHECNISNHVHIAPGVVLAGNVYVGERTFIGANSVIKQGIKIGKDVLIGAGSVVLNDIPDGKKVVGNPSRFIL